MTIQLTSLANTLVTSELPVPCFFRDKSEHSYIGLLDENTIVKVYRTDDLLLIQNSKLWLCEGDLIKASKEFHSCTEAEFMEAYADVEQRMSLNPILAR